MQKAADDIRDAVQAGNLALVQELWSAKAKALSVPKKVTLLHDCFELFTDEQRKTLKFLIAKTPKKCFSTPHRRGKTGRFALSSACLNSKIPVDMIKQVHKRDTTVVTTVDEGGRLPLHAACLCSGANHEVVDFVADLHPEAVRQTVSCSETLSTFIRNGYCVQVRGAFLPFHCACSPNLMRSIAETMRFTSSEEAAEPTVSLDVVKLLVSKFPECLDSKSGGDYGDCAVELLLDSQSMNDAAWELLLYLVAQRPGQLGPHLAVSRWVPLSPPEDVFQKVLVMKAPAAADAESDSPSVEGERFTTEQVTAVLEEAIRKRLSANQIRCIIDACPDSFQQTDALHLACSGSKKSLEVVQYLYGLDQHALHVFSKMYQGGLGHPLHTLVAEWNYNWNSGRERGAEETQELEIEERQLMDIVQFLVHEDPSILQIPSPPTEYCVKFSPLRDACRSAWDENQEKPSELIKFLVTHSSQEVVREAAFSGKETILLLHLPDVFPQWSEWRDEDGNSLLHIPPKPEECYDPHFLGSLAVRALLTDSTGVLLNKLGDTPLHSCIRNLPGYRTKYNVEKIDERFPLFLRGCLGATTLRNHDGMMPIHMLNQTDNDKDFFAFMPMLAEVNRDTIGFLDGKGRNVLHTACADNHAYERVKVLVDSDPNAVFVKDEMGRPLPFHALARDDNFPTLELILAQDSTGKLALEKDALGNSLLHVACKTKACSLIIQYLLRTYPEMAVLRNKLGFLPLHLLLSSQEPIDLETVEMMYQCNQKSVTIRDPQTGMFPFQAAALLSGPSLDAVFKLVRVSPPDVLIPFSACRLRPNKRQKTK